MTGTPHTPPDGLAQPLRKEPAPIAVLTRPAGQSEGLAQALHACGWQVHDWPALLLTGLPAISVPDPSAFDLVMFVSGNAVRFYFQQLACMRGVDAPAWPQGVAAATVGPGSARALRECAGDHVRIVQPAADAPNFDSEALWAEMQRQELRPRQVLIVRGGRGAQGHGRGWLAEKLADSGASVTLYAAYRRAPAVWPPQRRGQVLAWQAAGVRPVWLISSREALDAVAGQLGKDVLARSWQGCRVIAPHPRIAQEITALAGSCGIATTLVAGRPPEPNPQVIMIQTCMPHDDAVLNAIVN